MSGHQGAEFVLPMLKNDKVVGPPVQKWLYKTKRKGIQAQWQGETRKTKENRTRMMEAHGAEGRRGADEDWDFTDGGATK